MSAIDRSDLDSGKIDFSGVTTGDRIAPVAPGALLREILDELGVSPYRLARLMKVPLNRVTAIISGKRAITADTSIRLGRVLGQSDYYWLNLQSGYDVAVAEAAGDTYDTIESLR